ncbi:MAG TPA: queuosine precursor transporter, partial [Bacteroidales bacterium]|nr:queuosine precursor transporter [Bacteroidales bacterium]
IFSLEALLGIPPLHLKLPTGTLDMNLSVGVIIWPLVFIFSDIVNEYFGKEGVRKMSFLTAILIGYSFFVIYAGTKVPPAPFWLEINNTDPSGNAFNINYAYSAIFRQGMGIIIGSITAFLVSQMIDAYAFQYIKKITGHKKLWLRATGSTVISQFFDSFVILFIAFYFWGNWSVEQVLTVGIVQYIYKVILATVLTPLLYVIHYIIDWYLSKNTLTS